MELFDEGEVTTADQMDRPQKALDREMFQDASERFNKADGGRIGFKDEPLKNFNRNPKGQNQFTGKLLTENMDLVNAIKGDAKTMSQIEVEKKYKGQLGKKTLKK